MERGGAGNRGGAGGESAIAVQEAAAAGGGAHDTGGRLRPAVTGGLSDPADLSEPSEPAGAQDSASRPTTGWTVNADVDGPVATGGVTLAAVPTRPPRRCNRARCSSLRFAARPGSSAGLTDSPTDR